MGCTSSHAPEDHNPQQQFYTTATSKNNVFKQPLNTQRPLPRNGTISVQSDKYDGARKMINYQPQQQYNDYEPQRQGSMHSVLSSVNGPSVATLCEKLELNISLRNIPKLDLMSPSDPFVIVSIKDEVKNIYLNVGKTNIVWDNPNPDFSKDIRINYLFEEIQYVKLDIYDANEQQTNNLSKFSVYNNDHMVSYDIILALNVMIDAQFAIIQT